MEKKTKPLCRRPRILYQQVRAEWRRDAKRNVWIREISRDGCDGCYGETDERRKNDRDHLIAPPTNVKHIERSGCVCVCVCVRVQCKFL